MPSLIFSDNARRNFGRLVDFIKEKNPQAAQKAAQKIIKSLKALETQPNLGRIVDEMSVEYRELLIPFGGYGYVARYHYTGGDMVEILAIRHYREVGFQIE